LVGILLITYLVDHLGTAMFHRGFAKPFYIKGRRIHHKVIYLILPAAFGLFVAFYILGYVLIPWQVFWARLSVVGVLSVCTLAIDFIGDKFWPKIRKNVVLHHEWFYALIPAAVFTYLITIVV